MCECFIIDLIKGTTKLELCYQNRKFDYMFLDCTKCKKEEEYFKNFIACEKCHACYCDTCRIDVMDIHLIIKEQVNCDVTLSCISKLFDNSFEYP